MATSNEGNNGRISKSSNPKDKGSAESTMSWGILLFSALFFALSLGALEVLLRTTHLFDARISWAEPDDLLGWKNAPGKTYWNNRENDHPISGTINGFGFRDKEWSLEKESGVYRIAVVGDSYVEAIQVESEKTFISLAESKLNESGLGRVEMMNFGQSGFTQTHELIVLKEAVLRFDPDMVIVLFVPSNDIQDISRETTGPIHSPFLVLDENDELVIDTSFNQSTSYKIKSFVNPLKQNSAIISLLIERYNLYKGMKALKAAGRQQGLSKYLSLSTGNPDPAFLKNYGLGKRAMESMIAASVEKSAEFMLIVINSADTYILEVEERYLKIDPSFNHAFFEDDLGAFAKANNVHFLGLQRIFREDYERNRERLHWGHWNYRGHEVVAEALAERLTEILSARRTLQ